MSLLSRTRVEMPDPEGPPPHFVPLPPDARGRVLELIGRQLAQHGIPERGDDFVFVSSGRQWLSDGVHMVAPDETFRVSLAAPADQRFRSSQPLLDPTKERWAYADLVPGEVSAQLDNVFVGPHRKVWLRGSPWPPQPVPFEEWPTLSSMVCKTIRRAHGTGARPPAGHWTMATPAAYDPLSGRFLGTLMDPEVAARRERAVVIPVGAYAEDLNLEGVRVDPVTGRVTEVGFFPGSAA